MKAGTNYLGFETQEQMQKAVIFASEFLEMNPNEVTEFHVQLAWTLLETQNDLRNAQALIAGTDPSDEGLTQGSSDEQI